MSFLSILLAQCPFLFFALSRWSHGLARPFLKCPRWLDLLINPSLNVVCLFLSQWGMLSAKIPSQILGMTFGLWVNSSLNVNHISMGPLQMGVQLCFFLFLSVSLSSTSAVDRAAISYNPFWFVITSFQVSRHLSPGSILLYVFIPLTISWPHPVQFSITGSPLLFPIMFGS